MKNTLSHALQLVAASEGGWSKRPEDPGGATMRGITLRTLSAYTGRQATDQDLRQISDEDWSTIMTSQYAAPVHYNELPAGLDYCVLDAAVNSGPSRATKLLQQTLGMSALEVDGVVGHHTLEAVSALRPTEVDQAIRNFCAARLAYMRALKTWRTFGSGWKARVDTVRVEALAMSQGDVPLIAARDPIPEPGRAKAFGPTRLISVPSGKAVAASAVGAATTVGTAATQVTAILEPHADHQLVQWILLSAALLTAASTALTVLITRGRTESGATT